MPKKHPSINLVKTRHVDFFERFIGWALTIGRLVVIGTELIALICFVYRFSLDSQLIDLHSKIKQEQAVINFLKKDEETYRNLQDRLSVAGTFSTLGSERVKIFNDILGMTPQGITYTDFSLSNERLRISADVESVFSLSSLVESLKKYPEIDSVSIDKIDNRPSLGIIKISITTVLKKEKDYVQN
jgi:hypothetical protein